jgi:hypothetical protein
MKKAVVILFIAVIAGAGVFLDWQEFHPLFGLYRQYVDSLTLPDEPTLNGYPKLVTAFKKYTRDHVSPGKPLPASISLQDLVNGGYLTTNDVKELNVQELTIYPTAGKHDPKAVMVRMRMPDGRQILTLADGSTQQLPR